MTLNKANYNFYTNRAYEIGQQIAGDYDGYKLSWKVSGFNAEIFFENKKYFDKTKKNIGTLCFNPESEKITYYKTGFVDSVHKFNKTDCIGICWDILKHLTPTDCILIEERVKKNFVKKYFIPVRKALTYATPEYFMQFKEKGFERQLFIPEEAFKVYEKRLR